MSPSDKPVVVLVHGVWHLPIHYMLFIQRLRREGYTVAAPRNPTSGWQASVGEKTFQDDVQAIKDAINPYLEAGMEIVVVGHSYGSLPATDCVPGNTVEERKAKGLKGGIKAMLHVASVVPLKAGLPIMEQINLVPGGAAKYDPPPTWWGVEDGFAVCYADAPKYLCSDVDEPTVSTMGDALAKTSALVFGGASEYSFADAKVPHTYVICVDDKAVDPEIQVGMAKMSGAAVVRLRCGHNAPFLVEEHMDALVEILSGI